MSDEVASISVNPDEDAESVESTELLDPRALLADWANANE